MDKSQKPIIVCTDPDNGVLFARVVDSNQERFAFIGSEIARLLNDFEGSVTLENIQDGLGDAILHAEYGNGNHLEYKMFFAREENA